MHIIVRGMEMGLQHWVSGSLFQAKPFDAVLLHAGLMVAVLWIGRLVGGLKYFPIYWE